ncbi:MAG: HAD family hydrolase [Sedimentisphaerales bacterium]|nr:HAD family hydrolase [Sedimentisphaerales bacterium]
MKQAVIFDLDGTLVDTLQDLTRSVNYALDHYGLPDLSLDEVEKIVGNGAITMVTRALPPDRVDLAEDVLYRQQAYYRNHYADSSQPYPGIIELLYNLREKQIKCAVLSNKPDVFTRTIINSMFTIGTFTVIRGHIDDTPLKPEPVSALKIASELNVAPADVLFVGDTAVDMQTACNAGMKPIGVTWGFRDSDELLNAGAAALIDRPSQLLEWL